MDIRKLVESKLLYETVSFRDFEKEDYYSYAGVESDSPKILQARDDSINFAVDIIVDGYNKEIDVYAGDDLLNTAFDASKLSKDDLIHFGQLVEDGKSKDAWELIKSNCEEVPVNDGAEAIDAWFEGK